MAIIIGNNLSLTVAWILNMSGNPESDRVDLVTKEVDVDVQQLIRR